MQIVLPCWCSFLAICTLFGRWEEILKSVLYELDSCNWFSLVLPELCCVSGEVVEVERVVKLAQLKS